MDMTDRCNLFQRKIDVIEIYSALMLEVSLKNSCIILYITAVHIKTCFSDFSVATTARKVSKYGVFSSPYFPVIGLNTEIYNCSKYRIWFGNAFKCKISRIRVSG